MRLTGKRWKLRRAASLAVAAWVASHQPAAADQRQTQQRQPSERGQQQVDTAETEHKHTNRLIKATSPYLLQHAHNPVDWYEWGEDALAKARKEDKPVFLSIGYSACHWCHVMEHEVFENKRLAGIMNEHFVSIKVDREERPDIDEIYMQATVAMTGHGGWPMSVFMTPDGKPFFAGTYFPPPQFEQLLLRINDAWHEQRQELINQSEQVHGYLQRWAEQPKGAEGVIPEETVVSTAEQLAQHFDMQRGGLASGSNKFPPSMTMELLLRAYVRTDDKRLLDAVTVTLDNMADGGIYDHLGGGICRYSTDPDWLVPHFEKMLYDQALVSAIYLDGYLATGDERYAETTRGICDYVIRDLQSPEGGLYSTRDADSEGMEGKFYIWTVEQVEKVLGAEDAKVFCDYYDVTAKGNWFESRGHAPSGPKNILNVKHSVDTVANRHRLEPDALRMKLATMRRKMFMAREKRVHPGLDDKILTGWNGLMIASLAKAAAVLDEPRYTEAAERAADFVLRELHADGKLLRTYRHSQARLTGYLTDYAFLTEGLLNLYEATGDPRWLRASVSLTDNLIERYHDEQLGGFFFTASDGEQLVARTKDARDGAIPGGNSVAAMNLLRLATLTGNKDYRPKAESIFRAFAPLVEQSPAAFEKLLCAVDFYYAKPKEIAIIGEAADEATKALRRQVYAAYRPNKVVALARDASEAKEQAASVPLLKGRKRIEDRPTAYVCVDHFCRNPVNTPEELAKQLDAGK